MYHFEALRNTLTFVIPIPHGLRKHGAFQWLHAGVCDYNVSRLRTVSTLRQSPRRSELKEEKFSPNEFNTTVSTNEPNASTAISPKKAESSRQYRRALTSETDFLLGLCCRKEILTPTHESLEASIRKGQVFVATKGDGVGKPIGMGSVYFTGDSLERERVLQQFQLFKPVRVINAGFHSSVGKHFEPDVRVIGSEQLIDLEHTALFYCSSFSVVETERRKLTAVRLAQYGLSQQRSIFEHFHMQLKLSQECPDVSSPDFTRFGLVFGTTPTNKTAPRIAIHELQNLIKSVWGECRGVYCVTFEHVRPDGEEAQGILVLFGVCSQQVFISG